MSELQMFIRSRMVNEPELDPTPMFDPDLMTDFVGSPEDLMIQAEKDFDGNTDWADRDAHFRNYIEIVLG